jgi:hypothetical protein
MAWKKSFNPRKYKNSQQILAVILLIALIVVGLLVWFIASRTSDSDVIESEDSVAQESVRENETKEPEQPAFNVIELQAIVDSWVQASGGSSSVVVSDIDNNILAAHNADEIYFAASIYKLYVAYAGYQQVDSGAVDPDELYVNGNTRGECLDLMIRDSDSPCAEKLWNELGKAELTEQLKTYGIENTSIEAITTTAFDASLLLGRVVRGEGLSDKARTAYLDSMKDQDELYRRGLPSEFTASTVYNKVGWNELVEWHDTAIVEAPDGRKLIVSVLTENVGFRKIGELGSTLETYLIGT